MQGSWIILSRFLLQSAVHSPLHTAEYTEIIQLHASSSVEGNRFSGLHMETTACCRGTAVLRQLRGRTHWDPFSKQQKSWQTLQCFHCVSQGLPATYDPLKCTVIVLHDWSKSSLCVVYIAYWSLLKATGPWTLDSTGSMDSVLTI